LTVGSREVRKVDMALAGGRGEATAAPLGAAQVETDGGGVAAAAEGAGWERGAND
jgi:hypothetical protein